MRADWILDHLKKREGVEDRAVKLTMLERFRRAVRRAMDSANVVCGKVFATGPANLESAAQSWTAQHPTGAVP